jgi:hypothetical protein
MKTDGTQAGQLSEWLNISRSEADVVQGCRSLSPYDIPRAVRSFRQNGRAVLEFQYLSGDEPKQEATTGGISTLRGANSKRIYQIRVEGPVLLEPFMEVIRSVADTAHPASEMRRASLLNVITLHRAELEKSLEIELPPTYRKPDLKREEKDVSRLLNLLLHLPMVAFKPLIALFHYARSQKISSGQALDEAIMALPTLFPDAIEKLSEWEAICRLAGIPTVPVSRGPSISVQELEAFAETHQPTPATDKLANWIEEQRQQGNIWRWECCAPEMLKLMAGLRRTEERHQGLPRIPFHTDERLFHILWSEKATEIGLVARPWTRAAMDDGFPVEFRVFFQGGGIAACNYYPQRALSERYAPEMERAVELTRQLAAFQVPAESGLPPAPAEFSCDWMVRQDGEVVFLEAGPPHTRRGGAHPCCFALLGDPHGGGPNPGRRLFRSEPGAQFYVDPEKQSIIDCYKRGEIDFNAAVRKMKLRPVHVAALFAVQGIIPREMQEKVIGQSVGKT